MTRAWIAPDTSLPRLNGEHAEAPQLDALAARERRFHRMKQRVHRLLDLQLRQAGSIGYALDNIYSDQGFFGFPLVVDPIHNRRC